MGNLPSKKVYWRTLKLGDAVFDRGTHYATAKGELIYWLSEDLPGAQQTLAKLAKRNPARNPSAADHVRMISKRRAEKLHEINQLTLGNWVSLAKKIGVPMNDRDHAAKILAIRELRAEGAL